MLRRMNILNKNSENHIPNPNRQKYKAFKYIFSFKNFPWPTFKSMIFKVERAMESSPFVISNKKILIKFRKIFTRITS